MLVSSLSVHSSNVGSLYCFRGAGGHGISSIFERDLSLFREAELPGGGSGTSREAGLIIDLG